jgi:hypothetical protein
VLKGPIKRLYLTFYITNLNYCTNIVVTDDTRLRVQSVKSEVDGLHPFNIQ